MAFLSPLVVDFLCLYGTFLGLYFATGLALTFWSRRFMGDRRIQRDRTPTAEMIRRDILQSCRSLAQISLFFALGMAFRRAGWGPRAYETSWGSVLIFLPISMLIFDAWFYWGHRLLHVKFLYRAIHQWHHEAITPTPWSNNSDKFLDNLFLQSYWMFVPLFLPVPTFVLIIHKIYDHVTGIIGHSGYEYNLNTSRMTLLPSVMHHDLHHSHQKYNFGSTFTFWDIVMRTLHPEYHTRLDRMAAQVKPGAAKWTGNDTGTDSRNVA
jgi:sterol desaturase/sphingolipid hydroxylase (fatty acid hydroxylase superfamily)